MPYRIEISPNNRATCKNKECKDNKIKIVQGEIRFGTWVVTERFESWSYKHWGCVTPAQIANLVNETGGDVNDVDGYEELPEDVQEKVRRAMEQGHVDDEDWRGDVERNRSGLKGMRTPQSAKRKMEAAAAAEEDDEEAPESPSKGKGKKRTKKDADEGDAAPKEKKGRGKKAKKEDVEDEGEPEEPPAKKQRGKAKKAKEETDADADIEASVKPKAKGKGKGKKAATAEPAADEMDAEPTSIFGPREKTGTADTADGDAAPEEVEERPKRGRKSKKKADIPAETGAEEPAKPKGRGGRKKKAA